MLFLLFWIGVFALFLIVDFIPVFVHDFIHVTNFAEVAARLKDSQAVPIIPVKHADLTFENQYDTRADGS